MTLRLRDIATFRRQAGPFLGRSPVLGFPLALVLLLAACGGGDADDGNRSGEADVDPAFEALQVRGEAAMGVDQYASVHQFDVLPEGGRIELQHGDGDPEAIATIRRHLQEIEAAFAQGDFSTPAFVHDEEVPGTAVMAARKDHIRYTYSPLPRGGEVRIHTTDPEALEAIRAFIAYQREDHRAGGHDHAGMDHSRHQDPPR